MLSIRLSEMNTEFVYLGHTGPTPAEYTLQNQSRPILIYGDPDYCKIEFRFDFNLATFKIPLDGHVFGISSLLLDAAIQVLPKVPGRSLKWSHSYNTQDIGLDIQSLFNFITPLPLQRHPILEIYAIILQTSKGFSTIVQSRQSF